VAQAQADLENAELTFKREQELSKQNVDSAKEFDQARTAYDAAKARVDSLRHQTVAAEAAVGLAKSTSGQIAARRAALAASQDQHAAASAQSERARVQLDYTQIHAPSNGIVDVRAALQGEVVNPGQGIVTLIDPGPDCGCGRTWRKLILTASISATSCRCGCPPARARRGRSFFAASTRITRRNGT
jgi:multidrug resistance efflux pump